MGLSAVTKEKKKEVKIKDRKWQKAKQQNNKKQAGGLRDRREK